MEENAYLELGNVSPVDLISFAYQIASGMVRLNTQNLMLIQNWHQSFMVQITWTFNHCYSGTSILIPSK